MPVRTYAALQFTPYITIMTTQPTNPRLQSQSADGYAGDITPKLAFDWWQAGEAVLVDIRTDAERDWVGFVPGAAEVAWKLWPGMVINPSYDQDLLVAVDRKSVV